TQHYLTHFSHTHFYPIPFYFFLFNDPAPTEIYTLSLHDALPIAHAGCGTGRRTGSARGPSTSTTCSRRTPSLRPASRRARAWGRSEEHTSELQSRGHLVCRLLLEKKKKKHTQRNRELPTDRCTTS